MNITTEQFLTLLPTNQKADNWVASLNTHLPIFQIDTNLRISAFMAQTIVESMYVNLTENLNYSSQTLLKLFPSHFTQATAQEYARNQEAIGNIIYANRMGNGDAASGDGYRFRGRSLIQITGKYMYNKMSMDIFKDDRLVQNPDYLATFDGAVQGAVWFWNYMALNPFADVGDIVTITKKINGGLISLDERMTYYKQCLKIFV